MTRLVRIVQRPPFNAEAVGAAIVRAGPGGDSLALAESSGWPGAATPGYGERLRRFGYIETNLVRVVRAALAAGLALTVARRFAVTPPRSIPCRS